MRTPLFALLALVASLSVGSTSAAWAQAPQPTLFNIVDTFGGYDSLAKAVRIAGLEEALDGPDSLTLYAPTDAAFVALPAAAREALLADSAALREVLLYHLRDSTAVIPETPVGLSFAATVNGASLQLIRVEAGAEGPAGDSLLVADSVGVEIPDVYARNGIFNAIGQILLPPDLFDAVAASPEHGTFEDVLLAAEFADTLRVTPPEGYTVFAPVDSAWADVAPDTLAALLAEPLGRLRDVLRGHLVVGALRAADLVDGQALVSYAGDSLAVTVDSSGAVTVGGARVTVADVATTTGVLHFVDGVLFPPAAPADSMSGADTATSVVDVIAGRDDLTTLATAIETAALVGALDDSTATFTVFAPADSAFAALPAGALDDLLDDPNELAGLLRYHVVAGALAAADLTDGMRLATLQGDSLTVTVTSAGVFVDSAAVTVPDLAADNGVVHVIDGVLMPAMPADTSDGGEEVDTTTVFDVIAASDVHATLETALIAAGLDGALDDSTAMLTVFAPTDAALAALDQDSLAAVLDDPSGRLADLLRAHVVAGVLTADSLTDGRQLVALSGDTLVVAVGAGGAVSVDGVVVAMADLTAGNGVVHVVGEVLVPAGFFTGTVESAAGAGFRVYPTVTAGAVRIEAPEGVRVRSVTAVDLGGRAVELVPNGDVLDLSGVAPGHYFLVLETNGGRYAARVVRVE